MKKVNLLWLFGLLFVMVICLSACSDIVNTTDQPFKV